MSEKPMDKLRNIADYRRPGPDDLWSDPLANLTPLEQELWRIVQYVSELLNPAIPGNRRAHELTQRAMGLLEAKAQGD